MMNFYKKMVAGLLSMMLIIIQIAIIPVQAKMPEPELKDDTYYAIISASTGKAVQVREVTWNDSGAVYVDGDVTNQKVKAKAAFSISKHDDSYAFASVGNNGALLKCENVLGNGIEFVFNYDTTVSDAHCFDIESADTGYKIKSNSGVYLGINENGRLDKVSDDEAEIFVFEEVSVIDEYIYIENVDTQKLVTFDQQNSLQPVKVTGDKNNVTDSVKFFPQFTTNDNYTMTDIEGKINTVSLKSKIAPNMVIISANWVDGPVSAIVAKETVPGGWESIVIEPAGNGQVYLRSSYTYEYITVNENDELALCDKTEDTLTNKEKFIIHSETFPEKINDLTIDTSSRTQTSLELSWTNPLSLYSQIEVYQKGPQEQLYTKISELTNENTYTVNDLKPGNEYSFKLLVINGNDQISTYSNEANAKTRVGDKPATPANVKIKKSDTDKVKISFDSAENATHYQLQRAPSAYARYSDVDGAYITKDETSFEVTFEGNQYENYYRVVAINNGENDKVTEESEYSDPSNFVSLETNLFGDHTFIFSPNDDVKKIDELLSKLFEQQHDTNADAQFKAEQYQIYFKPGDYTQTSCIYLGFYTSINGLGKTPYDVQLNNVAIPAYLSGDNATCNFWRSMENVSIIETGNKQGEAQYGSYRANEFNWAVAQAAPLRRVYSQRAVSYDWNYGWASGGYVADCYFEKNAGTYSGQQFYTRNSVIKGEAFGTTLNNFYQGVQADNLPDANTGQTLINNNGYSNWNIAGSNNDQQVFTNVLKTPEIAEKPFLYIDDDGEYQVFVPSVRKNTQGISWSKDDMGNGKSIPLSDFYIADSDDGAVEINKQISAGKNIYFTPGTYHAETPILVNRNDTVLLGTGMTSIIPDNEEAAMIIDDEISKVRVAGIIFDAGSHSEYLLKVGNEKNKDDQNKDPIILQDIFYRVGGTTDQLTKADNALEINADHVICDHFWIWRADHGAGVEWYGNESNHGLIVNGDYVTCYALFNEHFQKYNTLWNGEHGATYFYQNETAYDPISQEAWMSHNGTVNGYSSYKVSNQVKSHYAVGLGIYNVFINTGEEYDASQVQIQLDNAIEVPNREDVIIENACLQTFAKDDGALQIINTIINGVGDSVSSGIDQETGLTGEGWSRKFLISYQNGTAVVGKATNGTNEQKGKYIGVDTIKNVRQFGDDDLDVAAMKTLYDQYKDLKADNYTPESWEKLSASLKNAESMLTEDYLKYDADNDEFEKAVDELKRAGENLKMMGDKSQLENLYNQYKDLQEKDYTPQSWKQFAEAYANAKTVLDDLNATQKDIDLVQQNLQDAYDKLKINEDEKSSQSQSGENVEISQSHKDRYQSKKDVQTGDDSLWGIYIVMLLLSIGTYKVLRKKYEKA